MMLWASQSFYKAQCEIYTGTGNTSFVIYTILSDLFVIVLLYICTIKWYYKTSTAFVYWKIIRKYRSVTVYLSYCSTSFSFWHTTVYLFYSESWFLLYSILQSISQNTFKHQCQALQKHNCLLIFLYSFVTVMINIIFEALIIF